MTLSVCLCMCPLASVLQKMAQAINTKVGPWQTQTLGMHIDTSAHFSS